MSAPRALARIGAVSALLGAVVFCVCTLLHPSASAPNDLPTALAEYAASAHWIGIHLGQFVGIAAAGMSLVALAATFERGRAGRVETGPAAGAGRRCPVTGRLL